MLFIFPCTDLMTAVLPSIQGTCGMFIGPVPWHPWHQVSGDAAGSPRELFAEGSHRAGLPSESC